MFTLRRFHGLVQELVRGEWLRFVRGPKSNRLILGESEDLYEFLFGSERASLEPHTEILRDIQSGVCFYCQRRIDAKAQASFRPVPEGRPVDGASQPAVSAQTGKRRGRDLNPRWSVTPTHA
jgi:hypothetical protein